MATTKRRTLDELLDEYDKLTERRAALRDEIVAARRQGGAEAAASPTSNDQVERA